MIGREHYPTNVQQHSSEPPYQNVLPTHTPLTPYQYQISASTRRMHGNPPIWDDFHPHTFQVVAEIRADRLPRALYGLDMIEAERVLQVVLNALPATVNDHPLCPYGTTEELCSYVAQELQSWLPAHAILLTVSVSETPERVCTLRLI